MLKDENSKEEQMAQGQGQGRRVKRVTNVDVIRREQGGGQPGNYELELTLDNAQEFVMQIPTDEVSTVLRNIQHSESILFDTETQELTFEHYH
jgi:hypothetical protein